MGRSERTLHDAGNDRTAERYSDRRVARSGSLNNPANAASRAYFEAARRLSGETLPVTMPTEKQGFISKLFGRRVA